MCTRKDNYEETIQLKLIGESLEKLTQKIEILEKLQLIDLKDPDAASTKLKIVHGEEATSVVDGPRISNATTKDKAPIVILNDNFIKEEDQEGCSWLEDEALQRGEIKFLGKLEEKFWQGLIEKYLHPIDDTKDKV